MPEFVYQKADEHGKDTDEVSHRKPALQDHRGEIVVKKLADNRSESLEGMPDDAASLDDNAEAQDETEHETQSAPESEADNLAAKVSPVRGVAQRAKAQVRNLVGTSRLKAKRSSSRANSWKAHHQHFSAKAWFKCCASGCGKVATVGAHVERVNLATGTHNRYIVPFCQKHNKRPAGTQITLKAGSDLVSVGKGNLFTTTN